MWWRDPAIQAEKPLKLPHELLILLQLDRRRARRGCIGLFGKYDYLAHHAIPLHSIKVTARSGQQWSVADRESFR